MLCKELEDAEWKDSPLMRAPFPLRLYIKVPCSSSQNWLTNLDSRAFEKKKVKNSSY